MLQFEVIKCSWGGTRIAIMTGTWDECVKFCVDHNWRLDEGYIWDLDIREVL